MTRTLHKLTDAKAKSDRLRSGRHSDGGGLYLNVTPSGSKSWLFMWAKAGKRREMGLGAYPSITLASARTKATECRAAIAEGGDPIADRAKATEPTFGECADRFLASMEGSWRNEKHRAQWRMTLQVYCSPIRSKKVSKIGTDDVLQVLNPIWQSKPETASRLRGRIERVLDFAKAKGWRFGENPALWRGHLRNVLPVRSKLSKGHQPAMPYRQVPDFIVRLRNSEAMAARTLEFLILCASRSGEVYGARWNEVDVENGIWTIPAHRMKAGKEHRVPLSTQALLIVTELHAVRVSEYVFPGGQRPGAPLSSSAMGMLLRRMKAHTFTVHGFRSAFRDWAGDETTFPREIAEAALAHRIGDPTEQAYDAPMLCSVGVSSCRLGPITAMRQIARTSLSCGGRVMDFNKMLGMTDKDYCWVRAEYDRCVRAGLPNEAKRFVAQKLREGYGSTRFRGLAADLIDPDVKHPRGRPKGSHLDDQWHAIGQDFEDLRECGAKYKDVADALADKYRIGPRTIETFAANYQKTMRDAYKIQKEWEQEFASWPQAEQDAYYREQELAAGEEEPDPVFHEQCRSFLDAKAADAYRVHLACPHGCYEGCRKSTLHLGRRECALRTANK